MLKVYCSSCGACHQYSSIKPNFCSKCGLNLFLSTNANKSSKVLTEEDSIDNSFEESEILKVPKISNLDVEIYKSQLNSEKILDIIESSSREDQEELKNLTDNHIGLEKIDNKKFLEDFAQEAGALRPRTREHKKNGKKE